MREQRRRRLVENDEPRLARNGLGDRDHRALVGAQLTNGRVRRNVETDIVHDLNRPHSDRAPVDQCTGDAGQGFAKPDVFLYRQAGNKVGMLVDDRDPGRDCFMRAGKFHGFAIDEDVAGSWTLRANDAFDQRRFASAVLTQKGVNFAMPDVETDAVERARAGILLGQTANFEHRHGQIVSRSRDGSNNFAEGHAVTIASLDVRKGSGADPEPEGYLQQNTISSQQELRRRTGRKSRISASRPWPVPCLW